MNGLRLLPALIAALALTHLQVHAGEAEIRKNLSATLVKLPPIEEVKQTAMPGIWEVRLGGAQIFYTDANGQYVLQGNLIDTKTMRNLTEERINKLTAVDFEKLPFADAFKFVRGDGKRKVAIFEDPNCGYCKQFERELAGVDNITVHVFLYPVLGPDSVVKSRNIWCASDKHKTWSDWMLSGTVPETKECDVSALTRNRTFGEKYKITGTPTLFFADGTRAPGAIPVAQLEKLLAAQ
ncbi:MAG: DsbC family protein [Variovorax sp.]